MTRALIQELDPAKTEVALLTNPRWNPEEFLSEILYQLGPEEGTQRALPDRPPAARSALRKFRSRQEYPGAHRRGLDQAPDSGGRRQWPLG